MVDNNKKLSNFIVAIILFALLFVGSFAVYELLKFEAEVFSYQTDTSSLQAFAGKFTAQLPGIPKNILEEKGFLIEKNPLLKSKKNPQDFTTLAIHFLLVSGGVGISIVGLLIYFLKRGKNSSASG